MTIFLIITSFVALVAIIVLIVTIHRLSILKTDMAVATQRLVMTEAEAKKAAETFDKQLADYRSRLTDTQTSVNLLTEQLSQKRSDEAALRQLVEDTENRLRETVEQAALREKSLNEQAAQREAQLNALAAEREEKMLNKSVDRFQVIATDILRTQTQQLQTANNERLGQMLNPLKDDIERFRKDVAECYSAEARERFSLQERIKELIAANENIGREAKELSLALRGNSKTQGDWGEMVLESILENSGLRRDHEYVVQMTTDDEGNTLRDNEGRGLRPDVVVRYPGGRVIVIDSKVSLTAFVQYANAESAEDRERFGKQHVASVVKHINELAEKKYQDYVGKGNTLDFVMMFVSNEAAYAAAVTLDPLLWQRAYEKRVLLVSPTQLVGSLRLVSQLWNQDRQTKNALEIAKKSGQMYDKFVGFVSDMETIAKHLNSTRTAFDAAMNKLATGTGNLVSRAENLREMGAKTAKKLNIANQSEVE